MFSSDRDFVVELLHKLRLRYAASALDISWITPEWAVGAAPEERQLSALAKVGITSILDLRAEVQPDYAIFAQHGLRLNRLPVEDTQAPTAAQFTEGSSWVIEELAAARRVLLCCRAGSGRSVIMACAVLFQLGYSESRTLSVILSKRSVARPTEAQALGFRDWVEECRHPTASER